MVVSAVLRPGLELVSELEGQGEPVERRAYYRIRLRMWLRRGDPVRWSEPTGMTEQAELLDGGTTLVTSVRIDRDQLIDGLFYACLGMCIGGTRILRIAPRLGYGDLGVPGTIPEKAMLTAEISILGREPLP